MDRTPDISVVMGVCNNATTLPSALASILSQEGVDLEFIVIDDGSTDGSAAILDAASRGDPRLKVVHKKNEGLTRALIEGCAMASAPWIARQDADDVSLPGRLKAQLDRARQADAPALIVCASRCRTAAGEMLYEIHPPESPAVAASRILDAGLGLCAHGAIFFGREAYGKAGGYRSAFYYAQDIDLVTRLAEQGPVATVPLVLYEFSFGPGSISGSAHKRQKIYCRMARKSRQVRMRGESDASLLLELERLRKRPCGFLGRGGSSFPGLYFMGVNLMERNPEAAWRYVRQALSVRPLSLRAWVRWFQAWWRCRTRGRA